MGLKRLLFDILELFLEFSPSPLSCLYYVSILLTIQTVHTFKCLRGCCGTHTCTQGLDLCVDLLHPVKLLPHRHWIWVEYTVHLLLWFELSWRFSISWPQFYYYGTSFILFSRWTVVISLDNQHSWSNIFQWTQVSCFMFADYIFLIQMSWPVTFHLSSQLGVELEHHYTCQFNDWQPRPGYTVHITSGSPLTVECCINTLGTVCLQSQKYASITA